jgi:hypothetical protein
MRYAGIAPVNVLPQFAYPLSGYINPFAKASCANCTMYCTHRMPRPTYVYCYRSFIPVPPYTSHPVVPLCYARPVHTWTPSGDVSTLRCFRPPFQLGFFSCTGAYVHVAEVVSDCKSETNSMTSWLKALSIDFLVRTLGELQIYKEEAIPKLSTKNSLWFNTLLY